MLDITGGDTAALTEITDAQDLLLRLDEPDLPALARLNVHRSILADRNAHVPPSLPAVWATVGHRNAPKRWPGRSPARAGGTGAGRPGAGGGGGG